MPRSRGMIERNDICQRCDGSRVARVLARCSDMCGIDLGDKRRHGYVPRDLGIGGGDDLYFAYCLDCGQIQGRFPLATTALEEGRDP